MLGPRPDSRGSKLGPEPASSEVYSTCLRAAGVPRGDVCPAPPPRPRPPPFRCGRSSAPGLHWPRRRPRGAGSSRLPQANRGAAGPYLCAHPGSQGVDGRVPEARAGVPARAAKENWVSARRKRPASPREPGEATVRPGNFAGGLRSEKRKEQLVLSPLPPGRLQAVLMSAPRRSTTDLFPPPPQQQGWKMTAVTSPPVPDRYPAWELAPNHRDAPGPGSLPDRPPSLARTKGAPHPRSRGPRACARRTRSTYPGAPVRTWVARR